MKITYLLRNPGIQSRTPEGWQSAIFAADRDGGYADAHLAELAETDFLAVGLEPVTEAVFARAPRLRLVQRLGCGYDNIDLAAASRRAIPVCNMPDFNAATVAEHTLMLILALLRRVFDSTLLMKSGHWPAAGIAAKGSFELRGKVLGLLGLGTIGEEVARRARAFDVEIRYYDPRRRAAEVEEALDVSFAPLEALLIASDVVSCHAPLTPETRGILGAEQLTLMKPTAVLVNTARGALVDEAALVRALQQGRIAGAGLDVFASEPLPANHPLRRCPNVLLTPHLAGQTREAMDRMVAMMLENIGRVARGEEPKYRVNGH